MKAQAREYHLPFAKGEIGFNLPPAMRGSIAVSGSMLPLDDVPAAIKQALRQPINASPLRAMAKPGDTVCIVFTDITRASPDHLLVPALLAELAVAGVRDGDITLLCGSLRRNLAVTSMPDSPGMVMSRTTTSGLYSCANARACTPSSASATTSNPCSLDSTLRMPSRTTAWSSATSTRIAASLTWSISGQG